MSELLVCRETVIIHYYTNSKKKKKMEGKKSKNYLSYCPKDILTANLVDLCLFQDERKHVSSVVALFLLSQVITTTDLYLVLMKADVYML